MYNEVVSRHLGTSEEILLLMPIKLGFVPTPEVIITYATRLKTLLESLYGLRAAKYQRGLGEPNGPVEHLETLFRVQWTVVEAQQRIDHEPTGPTLKQLPHPQLLVTAHFDRSWEDYFRRLRSETGALLDLIFSHCVGFDDHSCRGTYEGFIEWIRHRQRSCDFMYAAAPDLTADDAVILKELAMGSARALGGKPELIADVKRPARNASQSNGNDESSKSAYRSLFALAELRDRMFSDKVSDKTWGLKQGNTKLDGFALFDSAIASVLVEEDDVTRLVGTFDPQLQAFDGKRQVSHPVAWARHVIKNYAPLKPSFAMPWHQFSREALSEAFTKDVQANILTPARLGEANANAPRSHTTYGYALLLWCKTRGAWKDLLQLMQREVTNIAQTTHGSDQRTVNFAITYSGFERMGLSEEVLSEFPVEFRQGMDARAALLGDAYLNDPHYWQHPTLNGPTVQDRETGYAHVASIDAIVIVESPVALHSDSNFKALFEALGWRLAEIDVDVPHIQVLNRDRKEAFGFTDSISQPIAAVELPDIVRRLKRAGSWRDVVPLGELLLGYETRHRRRLRLTEDPEPPTVADELEYKTTELFNNGTFMVVRKLMQDVETFNSWVDRTSKDLRISPDEVRGLALGRSDDGAVLRGLRDAALGGVPGPGLTVDATDVPDGVLTVDPSQRDEGVSTNDFDYKADAWGRACPLHAHIRRVNPRGRTLAPADGAASLNIGDEVDTPRIVRRGMSYSTELPMNGVEKGLFFVAYNASIADQYEILQRWLNGGNSTGVLSGHNDLLTSPNTHEELSRWVYPSSGSGPRTLLERPKPFVQLRWGLYFFAPSFTALGWLEERIVVERKAERDNAKLEESIELWRGATGRPQTKVVAEPPGAVAKEKELAVPLDYVPCAARGRWRMDEVTKLDLESQILTWKQIIEEPKLTNSLPWREAEDVWAAVRAEKGGVKVTPLGVLVGTDVGARFVLGDDGISFSTRQYRERFKRFTLSGVSLHSDSGYEYTHYLSHDSIPSDQLGQGGGHAALAELPNRYLYGLNKDAFLSAYGFAKEVLDSPPATMQQELPGGGRNGLSMRDLARVTIARLCHEWFKMPAAAEVDDPRVGLVTVLDYFLDLSRGVFQVKPEPSVCEVAAVSGHKIYELYRAQGDLGPMADYLVKHEYYKHLPDKQRELILLAVSGAVVGFAPAGGGSLLRILLQWLDNGELWTVQRLVEEAGGKKPDPRLLRLIGEAIRRGAAAPNLYRWTEREVRLGDVTIPKGSYVIVGLGSAHTDARELGRTTPHAWMFGGFGGSDLREHKRETVHGCPAQHAGLLVLAGVVTALCQRKNLRREFHGVVSYDKA
jgi:deferrochelatase/peroxidase EfeB